MPFGNKKLKRILELSFMVCKVYAETLVKIYLKIIYNFLNNLFFFIFQLILSLIL
jgi:hypothetical protein